MTGDSTAVRYLSKTLDGLVMARNEASEVLSDGPEARILFARLDCRIRIYKAAIAQLEES